jgi:hypothetical protein
VAVRLFLLVTVVSAALVLVSCGGGNSPAKRCNLPDDYDTLQVPPDPCLWSDPDFGKTFTAAIDATNVAKGPCNSATYDVVGDDGTDRVYRDDDTLTITISYDAPGCVNARLAFHGYHVNGSPWANRYCREGGCNFGGVDSSIRSEVVKLTQSAGTVTFTGEKGSFPPIDVGSPPNLEGFELCSIGVGFDEPGGSHAGGQLNLPSEACKQRP